MNLATWSIRNPIPCVLLFLLLALAGAWGFRSLPVQDLPDIERPSVNISLSQPGAAPAQLETEVARKVEDSLASLDGLKHIRTAIGDGTVAIRVEFELGKKLSDALIETKDAVDRTRSDLPADLLQPTLQALRSGGDAILTYAVSLQGANEEALSWFVDDTLARALLGVPGVGRFERLGGLTREVRVALDPTRLAAQGATVGEVSRALRSVQQQSSGGRARLGMEEQSVRTIATVQMASELAALPIALGSGRSLRLDQLAEVSDTTAERTQIARLDGQQVVGFRVYPAKGKDVTLIAEGARLALARLQARYPGLATTQVATSVDYTKEQFAGSLHMLYEGAALAVLVVWLFLRDWRAMLVAASALPLSILPTFAAMAWFGFSLNTVSLLALAVTVGILVDDAIVEIENIERHARMGKPMREAAGDAVNEIALAVMATTMALVVVFLPTALMPGVAGLFFREFGWTAVVAVLASLLVARLLTPVMAAWLIKPHPPAGGGAHAGPADGRPMRIYLRAVRWCLAHRKTTLALAGVFLAASLALVPLLPTGLMPASDRGYTTVGVELPPGSALGDTLAVAEAARLRIASVAGVQRVLAVAGAGDGSGSGAASGDARKGSLILMLSPRDRRGSQVEVEHALRLALASVPGARFTVGSGAVGERLSLVLAGDDVPALANSARLLERELRGVPGLFNVSSTASLERPEIIVRPDGARAAEQGVSTAAIGETVRIATAGDSDAQLARLNLDNRQVFIRVRLPEGVQQDMAALANLRVRGRDGLVPLASVARLDVESGPARIERFDRRRYVTLGAELGGMPLGDALAAAHALPSARALPASVSVIRTGDAEIMGELRRGFGMAIVVGVLCVYCVLVLLFKDFVQPVTILSAIPLSLGGAFVGLLLGGSEIDIPALIGLVMLMGIVTKNSILLVEYAIVARRERGLALHEALVDACRQRARPILMTSIAMAAGMLPIALGLGADASFRQPMALAVIGGLVTSTALSLLVVPVVFVCVDAAGRLFGPRDRCDRLERAAG
ncbi:ACR/RND family transmembrane transporter [Variovorax paradoxus]|uniref:ACR/RND family transmembrane transporter n=1 Tax=Variovorax paradoxus TaxID=34073 RepID=A0A0D0N4B5_VARPD|nr:efflux RND transporter permease subunit [Variovorax paradoxus]KIQ36260.1 ACR/RND family transmembrane transporter [Variovorax paradoxus]